MRRVQSLAILVTRCLSPPRTTKMTRSEPSTAWQTVKWATWVEALLPIYLREVSLLRTIGSLTLRILSERSTYKESRATRRSNQQLGPSRSSLRLSIGTLMFHLMANWQSTTLWTKRVLLLTSSSAKTLNSKGATRTSRSFLTLTRASLESWTAMTVETEVLGGLHPRPP